VGVPRTASRVSLAGLGLLLAGAAGLLPGATLERLSFEDMVAKSTAIVRGSVISSQASAERAGVVTRYGIQVTERWKGAARDREIVVSPGGEAGGIRQIFAGAPRLTEGKDYVLFLWAGPSGVTQILGYTQGVFELPASPKGEAIAIREATGEMLLDPATGQPVAGERLAIGLRDLRTRIRNQLPGSAAQ
jgi:hypothetical protein